MAHQLTLGVFQGRNRGFQDGASLENRSHPALQFSPVHHRPEIAGKVVAHHGR